MRDDGGSEDDGDDGEVSGSLVLAGTASESAICDAWTALGVADKRTR
jgi:hypothetical protein